MAALPVYAAGLIEFPPRAGTLTLRQASGHEESPYHQTIERVLTLLPKRPAQVVIVDPNQAGAEIRGTLRVPKILTTSFPEILATCR